MFDHRKASFRVLTLVLLMASGFGAAALAQSPEGGGPSGPDVQLRPSAPDAAPIHSWVRLYRGPLNAWYQGAPANDIVETGDGGYVTAGNVNTCENAPYCTWGAVVRYGADGAVAWTRIFGQSGVPSTYLNGIVKTDDGGYAATGYTAAGGIGRVDLLVVKLDAFGTVMWQNTYGWADSDEYGQRIYQNANGTLTVAGSVFNPGFGGYYDGCYWGANAAWSVDLSSGGALLSQKVMGANLGPTVGKTSDGGTITVTSWAAPGIGWTTTLQKFDSAGTMGWTKSYYSTFPSGNGQLANGSVAEVSGGFVVGAYTYTSASGYHLCVFKVDSSGNVLWSTMTKDINGVDRQYPGQIEATADGGALIAVTDGYSTVGTRTLKVSAAGTPQWATAIAPSNATFLRMKPHSAGGYIIAGAKGDQLLARVDETGTLGPLICPTIPIAAAPFTPEPAGAGIASVAGPGPSVCNSHFVNPVSHAVSLLVKQGDYVKTTDCIAQFVSIWTPDWAQTGTQAAIAVQYINTADVTAHDTVVLVDLPLNLSYASSTGGGIYYPPGHQVFWKLGDVSPVGSGMLSVTVDVPWGEPPHSWTAFMARIAASNISGASFDRAPYLAYAPVTVASETTLTMPEITAELSGDPALKALFDYSVANGYAFFGNALRAIRSDGSQTLRIFLLSNPGASPAILTRNGNGRFVESISGAGVYKLFDTTGGYSWDQQQGLFLPWGTWALTNPAGYIGVPEEAIESWGLANARCQINCTINSIPATALTALTSNAGKLSLVWQCKTCAQSMANGTIDTAACEKCGLQSKAQFSENFAKSLPAIGTAVDWADRVTKCVLDCQANPNSHICTDDKKECMRTWLGALAGYDTVATTPCNRAVGMYAPFPTSYVGCLLDNLQKCVPGLGCVDLRTLCNGSPCKQKKMEIRTPHDPNDKLVDFKGDVLPGQLLHYTIEYENTGDATATGVFVQDTLDKNLDESTLAIGDGGMWSAGARQITWEVGGLAPGAKGSVTFGIHVKTGLAQGTEIVNAAEVNFPNALEVTPTNAVVNHVSSVAADPMTVDMVSGQMAAITLSGRDTTGGAVTFAVEVPPAFGALTGTAPNLSYIPEYQFSGQDTLYYTATGPSGKSQPARVVINVGPDPADLIPPAVVSTFPWSDQTGVLFSATAVSTNPDQFRPALSATFSEPLDPSTVTASTFTLDGKAGTVWYDAETRTAYLAPTTALAASTAYTAHLKTGIKDKAGNALMTEFAWSFTTETPVGLTVSLPNSAVCLTFPSTAATQTSPGQVVTVMSTGTQNLVLGTASITGANPADFHLTNDQCSGKTIQPGQMCTATVAFAPGTAGSKAANLSLPSNDPASPAVVSLVGTATAPPCIITCSATVPGSALATAPVSFMASATLTNCLSAASYAWAFGDGQTSSQQNPSHAYASAGTFNWALTVSADGVTCTKSGSITICALACGASASTSSGQAPLSVTFTGSASAPGGCSVTPAYDWNFGDGSAHSSQQNPGHTYTSAGSFTWTLTVSGGGATCTKTGTLAVSAPCTVTCSASAPPKGTAGLAAAFTGSAAPSNCSGAVTYDWDFGDGSSHGTAANASHAYTTPNTYNWTFRATAQGVTCTKTGTITVVPPPVIALIKKASPPFKLVVTGSNLQRGIRVFIDGTECTSVVWKNTGKIQLTGAIKTVVPKGTTHTLRFLNPDGGRP